MQKALRIFIVGLACVGILLGYYFYLSTKNDARKSDTNVQLSEVQAIVDKDFDRDYPETPRAVIKWYNRIITAYYGADYDEDEFMAMAQQTRKLLDSELLEANPNDTYMRNVREDIQDWKNRSKTIVNSEVCDTKSVTYKVINGKECAYVTAYYFTKENSSFSRTYQQYCLRQDAMGRWKIVAFKKVDREESIDF